MSNTEPKVTKNPIPNAMLTIGTLGKLNAIIDQFTSHLTVNIFTSDYCSACKAFVPVFIRIQHEFYGQETIFLKINVSDLPTVAQQFNVLDTPTTFFIKNHKGKLRQVGLVTIDKLRQLT